MISDRKDYHELSDKLRGQIIGATINLELVIEQFIALYFCSHDIKKTSKETSYTSDEIKEILELTYYCTNILMYWHHSENGFRL